MIFAASIFGFIAGVCVASLFFAGYLGLFKFSKEDA